MKTKYQHVWDKILTDNEKVQYEFSIGAGYKKLGLITWSIIGILFLFSSVGFGLFILCFAWFYYGFYLEKANVYAFTDKRVLQHQGWLSTHMTAIDYHMITDVQVHEPFFQRLLTNTGSLSIDTASSSKRSHEITFGRIDSPYEAKKRLDSLRTAP